MTFEERKKIILDYIDADLSGSIPDRPGYIPGFGQTPTIKGLADDTFNLILKYWPDRNKGTLVDLMLSQLKAIGGHKSYHPPG